MFFLTGSVKIGGILFNGVVSETMSGAMTGFILILPYAIGRLSGKQTFWRIRRGGGLQTKKKIIIIIIIIIQTSTWNFSGFGFGCLLLPVSLCLKDHFRDEFPSVMPLSMAGSYAGITVIPPLMELCRQAYGTEGTCVIFGALNWHLIPCGLLLRKPSRCETGAHSKIYDEDEGEEEIILDEKEIIRNRDTTVQEDGNGVTWCEKIRSDMKKNLFLFADIIFSIFFFVANARKLPADGWTLFLIPHTIEKGFPSITAAQVASVGGITGIIGRFIASASFKINFSPLLIYAIYFYLNGVIFILMEWIQWLSESLIAQYVASAFNGCLLSAKSGMTPGLLVYILDESSFRTAYGLLDFGNGVLSLMAGFLPGESDGAF
ncbi:hypothetical protein HOLleu_33049 [Holothuria leucospilota]|uniref:Uncharacterized protein n=1 Tax=Holothuria leucospilota TaxID=206669 RepID=A0A9Q0YPS5_HOLLE|nr:hypothetical protein HOLleu_33049 [Holothuria leucospilota]